VPSTIYPLEEWLPDNPGGLQVAQNVRAIAKGYGPIGAPQAVTAAVPGAAFNGGAAFIASDGGASLFVSRTDGAFYKYNGTAWTFVFTTSPTTQMRFAQFGDNILIAPGNTIASYGLISGVSSNPTSAPQAIDIAQTRDFVMAITTDNALQWCQFNNSADWTTGTNQADKQPSLWGTLKRIVGGEYVIALTDKGVVRGTYVGVAGGLDIIWQFDQISAEVGCMASGSVCNVGRIVFFLSERGFQMCDGNEVIPIADEKINRWFFSTYSRDDIANIWAAVDPRYSEALWAMPGSPGRILAYNWVLKRWTVRQMNVTGMMSGYTSGVSLDALDAIYGNLDAMTISLDDPSLQGGNPMLMVVDNSNVLNALTGSNLEATLMLENIEPSPGRRSRIRSVRLVTDATDGSITIDARMNAGDAQGIVSAATLRSNGKFPIRSNGRYNNITAVIPAGAAWTYVQGCELEFEPGDGR
jgi:hypothetical protein